MFYWYKSIRLLLNSHEPLQFHVAVCRTFNWNHKKKKKKKVCLFEVSCVGFLCGRSFVANWYESLRQSMLKGTWKAKGQWTRHWNFKMKSLQKIFAPIHVTLYNTNQIFSPTTQNFWSQIYYICLVKIARFTVVNLLSCEITFVYCCFGGR